MRQKLFIVGFNAFNERMYPHLYDVIKLLQSRFDVDYSGDDDRGDAMVSALSMFQSFKRIPYGILYLYMDACRRFLLQRSIKKRFSSTSYGVVIVIDHTALNLVSRFISGSTKLVFWSHDFIAKDRDWYKYFLVRRMISRNRSCANKISLLVAQDQSRLEIVREILGCAENVKEFQLPVALCDDSYARRIAADKMSRLRLDAPEIIQLGGLVERGSIDLIKKYQQLGSNIKLYIHGNIEPQILSLIADCSNKPEMTPLSNSFMAMRSEIAKRDIGFVCYLRTDTNHQYLERASGQTVEFLRMGIPVIVMGNTQLASFIEGEGAGVCMSSIEELSQSIEEISKHYSGYSAAARQVYERFFDLEYYFEPFCEALVDGVRSGA
jgi:glycosyltransferase involved in cell wall biosynthesis